MYQKALYLIPILNLFTGIEGSQGADSDSHVDQDPWGGRPSLSGCLRSPPPPLRLRHLTKDALELHILVLGLNFHGGILVSLVTIIEINLVLPTILQLLLFMLKKNVMEID